MAPIVPGCFVGGSNGEWEVVRMTTIVGPPLAPVTRLSVIDAHAIDGPPEGDHAQWVLRGTHGHVRYVERDQRAALVARQAALGRPEATCAAFIPIRKSDAWWNLAQDERNAIFEHESHHISASLKYLPEIARRLYQSRDLGEPFDFLTWFDYAPAHETLFDDLLAMLRSTREWQFVEREVDIRLVRRRL